MRRTTKRGSSRSISALGRCQEDTCQIDCPGNLPYLRQHAENPVDRYPRGGEAFRRAREEDKPIHVSVGYAAFHWCTHRADFLFREKVMIVKGAKLRAWAANDNPSV